MRRALLLLPLVVGLNACWLNKGSKTPDPVWERFNAEDDILTLEVTSTGSAPGTPEVVELHSSTGQVVIGRATVDPGSGPVGTIHRVSVEVDGDYADQIGKVEYDADSGDRGTWTITMDQDSADQGLWVSDVQSHGDDGEVRTDTFTFALWHLNENPAPADAATAQ